MKQSLAGLILPSAVVVSLVQPFDLSTPVAADAAGPLAVPVCGIYCDTRDPSLAGDETFPVAQRVVNGRRVVLHVSDVDGMAWGSIDDGRQGDSVWLDRTWGDGSTWDGLLGKASIPGTWTGTRTLMYNLYDPSHHRRGMIRACGDAQGIVCTEWVHRQVCASVCDGFGASAAEGDYQPVPEATLSGRRIGLHVDNRGLVWATLNSGTAGDEVWLDRSWDAGASWPGGSSLGRTSVPGAMTSTRTVMFHSRDVRGRLYGGAVRACGRAREGQTGSCTAWARPSADRPDAAADALMWSYDPHPAWWPSSWWNSAATLTTVIDHARRSGRADYRWIIDRTFEVNRRPFEPGERSGDRIEGDFISRAIDDSAWWAVAWIAAYDLTGIRKYLDEVVIIANYVHSYWDPSSCTGGVWWNRERTYKNAVVNGLYIRIAAALHNRLPGDTVWLNRANTAWMWFTNIGLINAAGLVNDGLAHNTCRNNGGTVWTYNQGLAIGAATEVWRATGDARHLATARRLADAAIGSPQLVTNGVLTEMCDALNRTCDDNQKQFKGIFMRYLMELADATGDSRYRTFAQTQADALWRVDRDSLNRIGQRWAGGDPPGYPNARDWRTQTSGLGALLAATP
jgi:predicted alpha-1,6-mannanase (GH76 family)